MTLARDPGLDTLLDLHGQTLFVDDGALGEIHCGAEVTAERPHGLSYSLTLHGPDGERLVDFDDAHPVRERRGPGSRQYVKRDHRHRFRTIRSYEYKDAGTLEDFWNEVDGVLKERGSSP